MFGIEINTYVVYRTFTAKEREEINLFFKTLPSKPKAGLNIEKIKPLNCYSARLNKKERLLFILIPYEGKCYAMVLDYIHDHKYDKSIQSLSQSHPALNRHSQLEERQELLRHILVTIPQPSLYYEEPVALTIVPDPGPSFHSPISKQLVLSKTQEEILQDIQSTQESYQVINGVAGGGKTTLSMLVLFDKLSALQQNGNRQSKLLYVAPNKPLVTLVKNQMQRLCETTELTQVLDQVNYYSYFELLQLHSDIEQETQIATRTILENWLSVRPELSGRKNVIKIIDQLADEIIMICWRDYDITAYCDLGPLSSYFCNESEKLNRKQVYAIFESFKQFCKNSNFIIPASIKLHPEHSVYQDIVLDEMQSLGHNAFVNLMALKDPNGLLLLMGDSHQDTSCLFRKSGLTLHARDRALQPKIHKLAENFRCAKSISRLANQYISAIAHLLKGAQLEDDLPYPEVSANETMGKITWHDIRCAREKSFDSQIPVIIGSHSHVEQAKKRFPNNPIYSLSDAKGMQFRHVILFKLFDPEIKHYQKALKHKLGEHSPTKLTHHGPKDKHQAQSNLHFIAYLRKLFLATTRAQSEVIIVDNLEEPLVNYFKALTEETVEYDKNPEDSNSDATASTDEEEISTELPRQILTCLNQDLREQAKKHIKNALKKNNIDNDNCAEKIIDLAQQHLNEIPPGFISLLITRASEKEIHELIAVFAALAQKSQVDFTLPSIQCIPPGLEIHHRSLLIAAIEQDNVAYLEKVDRGEPTVIGSLSALYLAESSQSEIAVTQMLRIDPSLLRLANNKSSFPLVSRKFDGREATILSHYLATEITRKLNGFERVIESFINTLCRHMLKKTIDNLDERTQSLLIQHAFMDLKPTHIQWLLIALSHTKVFTSSHRLSLCKKLHIFKRPEYDFLTVLFSNDYNAINTAFKKLTLTKDRELIERIILAYLPCSKKLVAAQIPMIPTNLLKLLGYQQCDLYQTIAIYLDFIKSAIRRKSTPKIQKALANMLERLLTTILKHQYYQISVHLLTQQITDEQKKILHFYTNHHDRIPQEFFEIMALQNNPLPIMLSMNNAHYTSLALLLAENIPAEHWCDSRTSSEKLNLFENTIQFADNNKSHAFSHELLFIAIKKSSPQAWQVKSVNAVLHILDLQFDYGVSAKTVNQWIKALYGMIENTDTQLWLPSADHSTSPCPLELLTQCLDDWIRTQVISSKDFTKLVDVITPLYIKTKPDWKNLRPRQRNTKEPCTLLQLFTHSLTQQADLTPINPRCILQYLVLFLRLATIAPPAAWIDMANPTHKSEASAICEFFYFIHSILNSKPRGRAADEELSKLYCAIMLELPVTAWNYTVKDKSLLQTTLTICLSYNDTLLTDTTLTLIKRATDSINRELWWSTSMAVGTEPLNLLSQLFERLPKNKNILEILETLSCTLNPRAWHADPDHPKLLAIPYKMILSISQANPENERLEVLCDKLADNYLRYRYNLVCVPKPQEVSESNLAKQHSP